MVGRIIKSVIETVRRPRVNLEIVVDLRQRTFELGGHIEAIVSVTPRRDSVDVVEGSVVLVLEYEFVRVTTTVERRGGSAFPRTVMDKSVDLHLGEHWVASD